MKRETGTVKQKDKTKDMEEMWKKQEERSKRTEEGCNAKTDRVERKGNTGMNEGTGSEERRVTWDWQMGTGRQAETGRERDTKTLVVLKRGRQSGSHSGGIDRFVEAEKTAREVK